MVNNNYLFNCHNVGWLLNNTWSKIVTFERFSTFTSTRIACQRWTFGKINTICMSQWYWAFMCIHKLSSQENVIEDWNFLDFQQLLEQNLSTNLKTKKVKVQNLTFFWISTFCTFSSFLKIKVMYVKMIFFIFFLLKLVERKFEMGIKFYFSLKI